MLWQAAFTAAPEHHRDFEPRSTRRRARPALWPAQRHKPNHHCQVASPHYDQGRPNGADRAHSTVPSPVEEAMAVEFRR